MERKPGVVIMGMGYIGLPTAALIASKEIDVTGVDISQDVVDTINEGKIHIVEPDLEGLVHYGVKEGYLKARTTPEKADVYIIAVPTPFKKDHKPDLTYVKNAIETLIPLLTKGALIIIESTSPAGTTEKVSRFIYDARPELQNKIHIAYCPERVLPGNIIYELEHNDRVIGGINEVSTERAVSFYKHFVKGFLHRADAKTAEMCKLVENSYRDVNIAFANELSIICDKAGIDVWKLISLANKHPRVNILQPGCGVGGHCIAVDPWFIVSEFPEEAKMIRTAREINNYKTEWVIEKIKNTALKFELENKRKPRIACMGLAFKPNIDDLRESPALYITEKLIKEGFDVLPVEPNITTYDAFKLIPYKEAAEQSDIIVFLVGHSVFKNLSLINTKTNLDFCIILN